jgi:murein DD-endopeptidase MepM/ murein hydrolase activator NlpD
VRSALHAVFGKVQEPFKSNMEHDKLEPNLDAQNVRHKRVFLKSLFFSRRIFRLMLDLKSIFKRRATKRVFIDQPVTVSDPFKKLIRQVVAISASLLIVSSIAPHSMLETGFTADAFVSDTDYVDGEEIMSELPPLLMDQEGFVLKTAPEEEEVSRIGMTDAVKHTVTNGDTLSGIAALYGVSVKTLMWENNLSDSSMLKVGQELTIPAVDGISHTVASDKETLSSIAKLYTVDEQLIRDHNNLETDTIQKGQKLFIPGGKKKEVVQNYVIARSGSRGSARNTFDSKIIMSTDDSPSDGKSLIFPTGGHLTQGFNSKHYAVDIADSTKPDVWAAASGTVVLAKGGCFPRDVQPDRRCGGGYGNHVVIDHGNGVQTLYGHLETIYVTEGQSVDVGQAIGKMGNTGRVYGATGIHLHFEVIDNGMKKNPAKYY